MKAFEYDLVVIGGGAAGLTAAGVGASLGAKVLLVERHRLGGDCTGAGCIPSKALLKSASVAYNARHAAEYGIHVRVEAVDFTSVMERVRGLRAFVYEEADRPEIYHAMGVETLEGNAHFVDAHTIEVLSAGQARRLSSRFFLLATGARAAAPPIDGLAAVPYLTNETLFELREQPRRLAIIGAGPMGSEMAQAFRRLGTEVDVLEQAGRIQVRDDAENAAVLRDILEKEGVRYHLDVSILRVSETSGGVRVEAASHGTSYRIEADALLVAAGRRPNIEELNLDAAGIAWGRRGIEVDDRCRTNVGHIYAAGDVTGRYQFTHMSEHMAKIAVTNALTKWPLKIDARHVPWVTYTDPELAQVGATRSDLEERGVRFSIFRFPFSKVDRAVTDGQARGMIRVYARKRSGKILGASIVGPHAGELIAEYALAMRHGVTLRQISDTIHPYPTYALGVRRAADQWYIQNYSPAFVRLLQKVRGLRGRVNSYGPDEIV